MATFRPLRRPALTPPVLVLGTLVLIAAYFVAQRFLYGLGFVTNLSPGYPWGIWVVIDIVVGTAFGCGGFAVALLVYVLNRREYHPLVRSALLGGLLGYSLAGVSVLVDLGRYWQAYNLLLPRYAQPNSVMFEVALCVMAYVAVLAIELLPAVAERLGLVGLGERLRKAMFVFVALGVLLPTMHQSSLGTVLVALGGKISPLWQTQWLPLLFLASALAMGYAFVIVESTLVSQGYRLPSEARLLRRLTGFATFLLGLFLAVRLIDLGQRGALGLAFAGTVQANLFLLETALFAAAFLLLLVPALRADQRLLFLAGCLLLAAGSLYRINAYLVAYDPGQGWVYFPSPQELMVTLGFVALHILGYLVLIKWLPVLPGHAVARPRREARA